MFKYDFVEVSQGNTSNHILLTPGEASFEIYNAFDTKQDGTPMIAGRLGAPMVSIKLMLKDSEGKIGVAFDRLIGHSSCAWKTKMLSDAIPIEIYNHSGQFDIKSLIGHTGQCIIKREFYKDKDGKECEKNAIVKYLPIKKGRAANAGNYQKNQHQQQQNQMASQDFDDDDIPF